ncbi:hypothetical protein EKO04_002431 [Ascochyta lentis]|uniref:Ricin B lectin domain-containing protein n=1 Tax=Ascochyta lentis TaxID=205686 RepID=A0A8H7MK22_9PLEO|nr:hypothetical protein EKO04_002431 [Ascochyta lentis]
MTGPSLDTNQWYFLYVGNSKDNALWGTSLYSKGKEGAVFLNYTQTGVNNMRWQIYPFNDTSYIIRSKAGGANALLGTHYVPAEQTEGHTRPYMVKDSIADDSVFWQFGSWGDDSWWLTNARNGTTYHLNLKPNGLLTMDPNISAAAWGGQSWKFGSIEKIDDQTFSSVTLPSATSSSLEASATTTESSTSSSPTTTTPTTSTLPTPASTGLSTASKAGLGAGLGIAFVLVFFVLVFFYRRKRNARSTPIAQQPAYEPDREQVYEVAATTTEPVNEGYKHELPCQSVVEVEARQEKPAKLAELAGDMGRR